MSACRFNMYLEGQVEVCETCECIHIDASAVSAGAAGNNKRFDDAYRQAVYDYSSVGKLRFTLICWHPGDMPSAIAAREGKPLLGPINLVPASREEEADILSVFRACRKKNDSPDRPA